jgi:serine protease
MNCLAKPGSTAALAWAALACALILTGRAAFAQSVGEYNPVRRPPVSLGPEAHRLIVGFRTFPDAGRTVVARRQSRAVVQAQTSAADVGTLIARVGMPVAKSRQFTPSMHVLFLPKTLYGADVDAALAKLRADPAVKFADVDQLRHIEAVIPNDPLFAPTLQGSPPASGQWYLNTPSSTPVIVEGSTTEDLSATDAVSAWGITNGSPGIVIADVDTGVRFDHPDLLRAGLGGRLLPGYDFVGGDLDPSDGTAEGTYLIANDGDGWDPDPSDPGDWISTSDTANALFANDTVAGSTWHGTRVVGVYGAITNNDVGIAGTTWGAWVLPVRALGKGGGYDSDIIAGIEWAAGLPVTNPEGPPVPNNPFPADIVNLSLGSSGACLSDYQDALEQVTAMGVLVIVSAGNGGAPGAAAPVDAPANCSLLVPGVMGVVGLRNVGTKVGYSSFGSGASIAAPAGNCVQTSGDCLRSIDTTTNLGTTVPGENSYTNELSENLGTSFSAPIVSGIAGLMRSVNYNLTPAQLAARLRSSATPFPSGATGVPTCPTTDPSSGECVCPNDGSQCGAGMVNALSAVKAAQRPIGVIVIPKSVAPGAVFDASGSVAACNGSATAPAPLGIASYAWTASPSSLIVSGAKSARVTVNPAPGTLTLTVTDSAGNIDTETVTLTDVRRYERHRMPRRLHGDAGRADGERIVLPGDDREELGVDAHHHALEYQWLRAHAIELRADAAHESHPGRDPRCGNHLRGRRRVAHEHDDRGESRPCEHPGRRQLHHHPDRRDRHARDLYRRGGGAGAHDRTRRRQSRRRDGESYDHRAAHGPGRRWRGRLARPPVRRWRAAGRATPGVQADREADGSPGSRATSPSVKWMG